MSDQRAQFLSRVKAALANRGEPVELPDDLELARIVGRDADLVPLFIRRCEEAKMYAYEVASEDEMITRVLDILREINAKTVLIPEEDIPARDRLLNAVRTAGVTLADPNLPDVAFEADAGITGVTAAVAETASMVVTSGQGRRRLASLAVPVHIGIVRAEQILPDLVDWFGSSETGVEAAEVLISAPSKTADIEMSLVMGVHGPKQEHVIVLRAAK